MRVLLPDYDRLRPTHRVSVLVETLRRAGNNITGAVAPVLSELFHAVVVMGAWHTDPLWPKLAAKLARDPEDYLHTVVMLSAACVLRDAGNAIGLRETGDARSADLWLGHGVLRVALEVKVPQALRWPGVRLEKDDAIKILRNKFRSSGVGPGGQINDSFPSLLVLGGYEMQVADIDALENCAARTCFGTKRRQHVMGVCIISLGCQYNEGSADISARQFFLWRTAINPKYVGDIQLGPKPPETAVGGGA